MDEELLYERHFLQLNQSRQFALIAKHCTGIEELIRTAQSREEAERISNAACKKFSNECYSNIIRTTLVQHIQGIVKQNWTE